MTKVRRLAELMKQYGLTKVHYEVEGTTIKLERESSNIPAAPAAYVPAVQPAAAAPAAAQPAEQASVSVEGTPVTSPLVGVVYTAREPGAEPFVAVGQSVKKGETICVIEAMKMFCDIAAPCDGTVLELLFENGDLAEFGQTLALIG